MSACKMSLTTICLQCVSSELVEQLSQRKPRSDSSVLCLTALHCHCSFKQLRRAQLLNIIYSSSKAGIFLGNGTYILPSFHRHCISNTWTVPKLNLCDKEAGAAPSGRSREVHKPISQAPSSQGISPHPSTASHSLGRALSCKTPPSPLHHNSTS